VSSNVVQSVPETRRVERGWPLWLPWAAVTLLGLVAWLALRGPSGTLDPQLAVKNRDGVVTYAGRVRDADTRAAILTALRTAFGGGNLEGEIQVDPDVRRASWLPRIGEMIGYLKISGVDFLLNGNAASIGGWLSEADRKALTNSLRAIFGPQASIGTLGDVAAEAVRAANDTAISALGAVGTSGASPDAIVSAMNKAIINFPSGSADIPADAMSVIRKSAEALKRVPPGTTIEVGGHTDNTGDPSRNLALSQRRADAVVNALISAGAPAAVVMAKGYGDTKPRATNDTEYGRFQNRRIEYAIVR
jgi:OmpA-OmpF porin, OOP family